MTLARSAPDAPSPAQSARRGSETARLLWLVAAIAVLGLAAIASVAFGARTVGWHDIVAGLTGDQDTIASAAVAKRVPRTVLAMLVGAALGLAGAVLQGVTRNPLGDPALLGMSSGAALAVVSGIAFFGLHSPSSYIWAAIAGAGAASVFVYAIGSVGFGGASPLKLALAGAATTAAFSSLISAILLPRIDVMNSFRIWQIGGVGGATFDKIAMVLPFLLAGGIACLLCARGLNSLALGDDIAAALGQHVGRIRLVSAIGAVALCGAAVAVAGPIAFVGLAVPHLCRMLIGSDHRWLLPFSIIVGAALLTAADVIGRLIVRPAEIDVGIVTAFLGAPFFIYIVRRAKMRAL